MIQYFPKPYEPFGGDINVKVDLFNNATGIESSKSAATSDVIGLKTEVGQLDIDKLKDLPTNLSNL